MKNSPPINPWEEQEPDFAAASYLLAANGWNQEHLKDLTDQLAGKHTGSLGYDGPLAVLAKHRVNIADFFKETVAVVTNPAIDRGREVEVFSTSSLLGATMTIGQAPDPNDIMLTLKIPILLGGFPALGEQTDLRELAESYGTYTLENVLEIFQGYTSWLVLGTLPGENVQDALQRLGDQAVTSAEKGTQCLILDDFFSSKRRVGLARPNAGSFQHR